MIILKSPEHLRCCVEFFWYATAGAGDSGIRRVKLIPDGKHGLIFQHDNGRSVIKEAEGTLLPVAFVYGQSSAPFVNYIHGNASVFGAFFKPHALKQMFKVDAHEIADGYIDLNELAGRRINEELVNLKTAEEVYHCLCVFFTEVLTQYGKGDELIKHSIERIQEQVDHVESHRLYKDYHISHRQFQRRFRDHAGISLSTYIRVLKFQRSLQLLYSKGFHRLAEVAYHVGYADQSHFIRDFKSFTGHTPKEIVNNEIVIPENAFAANPLLQTRRHIYF